VRFLARPTNARPNWPQTGVRQTLAFDLFRVVSESSLALIAAMAFAMSGTSSVM
jgi:hypothetical protein